MVFKLAAKPKFISPVNAGCFVSRLSMEPFPRKKVGKTNGARQISIRAPKLKSIFVAESQTMTNLSLSLAFGLGSVQALIIYWCNASACSCEIRAFSQSATCAHANKLRAEQAISQNIDINHPLRREFLHKNRCREMETSLSSDEKKGEEVQ